MKNVIFWLLIAVYLLDNINLSIANKIQNSLKGETEEIINVHIVSHTHDDAGWLATIDDYYTGNNGQNKCVKCILDSMIISLNANANRTFTYVEMVFFEKWYSNLDEANKLNVKRFVKEGRLDFANGGWVMNDEATTNYQHIIDQMRLGLIFLEKEFNYTPKVAWYLDPFGHSMTNAYLLTKLGFDKMVMVRIDHREKEKRIKDKTMQFNWRPYYEIDQGKSNLFTHITHDHYSPNTDKFPDLLEKYYDPAWFPSKLESIYQYFKEMNDCYLTNELLFLFGDDFTFRNPNQNYKNIEAMVDAFEQNNNYSKKIRFYYSTPKKYFEALELTKKSSNFPIMNGKDFFPYSDYKYDYWTGFYSSRPYLKGMVKDAGNYLQQTNNLILSHLISGKDKKDLKILLKQMNYLRRELGIAQHHDAVTGTARELVSEDYIKRLNEGIKLSNMAIKTLIEEDLKTVLNNKGSYDSVCYESISQQECNLKVYTAKYTQKGSLFIYTNPGINSKYPIKIKIMKDFADNIALTDMSTGENKPFDVICEKNLHYCVVNFIVNFSQENLYVIIRIKSRTSYKKNKILTPKFIDLTKEYIIFKNHNSSLIYNPKENSFKTIDHLEDTEYNYKISQGVCNYEARFDHLGKNRNGAYLMAVGDSIPKDFFYNSSKTKIYEGKILTQIEIQYDYSKLIFRIYTGITESSSLINVETIIYPHHPYKTEEFLLIVKSDINNLNLNNQTEFNTDTNGMKIIKRVKNKRFNFELDGDDNIASNFYPVTSIITINDKNNIKRQLNVYNDRSQAGTSLSRGEMFLVMNRWSYRDDRKGLSDGIIENNSSNINFQINHWITTGKNFDKEFLNSLINKKPIYAVYNLNNTTSDSNFSSDDQHILQISSKLFFIFYYV